MCLGCVLSVCVCVCVSKRVTLTLERIKVATQKQRQCSRDRRAGGDRTPVTNSGVIAAVEAIGRNKEGSLNRDPYHRPCSETWVTWTCDLENSMIVGSLRLCIPQK